MIRPITTDDKSALIALAQKVGLFGPNELSELSAILEDYLSANNDGDHFWITDDDDGLVGVAYCAPERMTQGTWNLLLIAVRPDYQGQGRGAAIIRYVEEMLTARGAHLLLVETSHHLEDTQAFYRKCGFLEEARIRDFYQPGDDKIVYRKALKGRED